MSYCSGSQDNRSHYSLFKSLVHKDAFGRCLVTFSVALEGFGAQVSDAVPLQVLRPGEGLPTSLLRADEAPVIVVFPEKHREESVWSVRGTTNGNYNFRLGQKANQVSIKPVSKCWSSSSLYDEESRSDLPFMSEQFGHAGEGPATAARVTYKRSLT